jgi:hypothetical protein
VIGARYERRLAEALRRLLPSLPADTEIQEDVRAGVNREADFVVRSGDNKVVIEAKTGAQKRLITTYMVNQSRSLLSHIPDRDAEALLITDLDFTSSAQQLLSESPQIYAVRWRGPRDDKLLGRVLTSILSGKEKQP